MSHEKKDSALQKIQLILLSAAIMIVLAQLNINLIINGFKISLAVICLPLFAFLFEHFPVFPVTLITAPGILLVRCIVEWLHSGEIAEAFWSYSPEMFFHLMYGGLFAIYVRFFPIRHFRLEQFLPILGIDVISNLTEIFVRLGTDALTTAVLLRLVIVGIGRTVLAVVLLASFDA